MTEESNKFAVKVGEFEGPLDILLNLVEKKKLFIHDVSLSQVADDYVAYIQAMPNIPTGDMANFLLVASTLMLIKSISLLPNLEVTPEEQQSIEELENRLKELERIRELSINIKNLFGKNIIFTREPSKNQQTVFAPTNEVNTDNLLTTIKNVILNLPKKEIIPQAIIKKVISIEEVIESLTKRIQGALKMKFSEFVGGSKKEKIEVVITFLGMLELVKQGIIDVRQDAHFQDIDMETKQYGVPNYS